MKTTRRYALYYAPAAGHPLWRAGCDWLGRDPESGIASAARPHRDTPRRYGFHATLKPPFALRDGRDEAALEAELTAFVEDRAAFDMPPLQVTVLGDFLALRPSDGDASPFAEPLRALADACVAQFDAWRRPASAADTARRGTPGLSAQQRRHVERWGYPYVFESWRFHMTLSDAPAQGDDARAARQRAIRDEAERHFAPALALPLRCEGVALYVEDEPGADFRLTRRFRFAGPSGRRPTP